MAELLTEPKSYSVQVVGGLVTHEGRRYTKNQSFPAGFVTALRYHRNAGCRIYCNGRVMTPAEIAAEAKLEAERTEKRHANPAPAPAVDPFKPPQPLRKGDSMPPISASREELLAFVRGYYGPRMDPLEDLDFGELRYHLKDLFVIPGPSPWKRIPPPPGSPEAEAENERKRNAAAPAPRVRVPDWIDALSDEEKAVLDDVAEKRKALEEKAAAHAAAKEAHDAAIEELAGGELIEIKPDNPPPPKHGAGSAKANVAAWLASYGVELPMDTSHAEMWRIIEIRFIDAEDPTPSE